MIKPKPAEETPAEIARRKRMDDARALFTIRNPTDAPLRYPPPAEVITLSAKNPDTFPVVELKRAIQQSLAAGRSTITFDQLCENLSGSGRLSSSIYRQQKFAAK